MKTMGKGIMGGKWKFLCAIQIQADKQIERHTDKRTEINTGRQKERNTKRKKCRQKNDWQMGRLREKEYKQAGK